jgi:hypothetical protein
MSVEVDAGDLYKFADEIVAKGGRLGASASQVLRDASRAAEEYQRSHMAPHRRTGDTIKSIGTDYTGDGRSAEMVADVGVTTEYWRFVEYGTVTQQADPVVARSGDAADTVLVLGLDDVLKELGAE